MNYLLSKKKLCRAYKYIIFPMLLITTITAKAQELDGENVKDQSLASLPGTNDNINYSNINNVDLHTGTLHITIPVYTYEDRDFKIPIALTYTATGYKPNIHASSVGLGWNLSAAGSITREIRGNDDFKPISMDRLDYSSKPEHAFFKAPFWGVDSLNESNFIDTSLNDYSNLDITNRVISLDEGTPPVDNINWGVGYGILYLQEGVETTPDIYYFNFLGHRGKFIVGNGDTGSKNFIVFDTNNPQGEYNIKHSFNDSDGYIVIFDENNEPNNFIITTGDGYAYSFSAAGTINRTTIAEWKLTKIVAPNGRKVEFLYTNEVERTCSPLASTENTIIGYAQTMNRQKYDDYWQLYRIARRGVCQLYSITIDNGLKISFNYSKRDKEELATDQSHAKISSTKKLDAITVVSKDGTLLKQCDLSYIYLGVEGGNSLMFLNSIYLSGEGSYNMDYAYDRVTPLPKHGSSAFDHWGFWNAETGLLPIWSDVRKPYFRSDCHLMMTLLHYPQGGYTSYKYEPHTYFTAINRNNNSWPKLSSEKSAEAGGMAIKEIITYSGEKSDASVTSRTFNYQSSYDDKSSGILLQSPTYIFTHPEINVLRYNLITGSDGKHTLEITGKYYDKVSVSSNGLTPYAKDNFHIEYSEVEELINNGANGSIKYHFSNYLSNPDKSNNNDAIDYFVVDNTSINSLKMENYSMAHMRGKLKSKEIYDSENVLLSDERYEYTSSEGVECWEVLPAISQFYKHRIQTGCCLLTRYCKTQFFPDALYDTYVEHEYCYNDAGQLIAIQTKNGDGGDGTEDQVSKTLIRYVGQTTIYDPFNQSLHCSASTLSATEGQMAAANIVKFPQEVITYRTYFGYNSSYKLTRYTYGKGSINAPYTLMKTEQSSGNPNSYSSAEKLLSADLIVKNTDRLGNPLEIWSRSDGTTTNIWGYDGLYLVATVQNASFANVKTVSGFANIENTLLTGSISSAQRISLENLNSSNVMVTTYTYKPFIGMTSIVNPFGVSQSYLYDKYGRIEVMKINDQPKKKFTYSIN